MHENAEQQDAPLSGQSAKAWLGFYSGLTDQQKKTFSDAMRPQFENIAHHPARPYDPRTGLRRDDAQDAPVKIGPCPPGLKARGAWSTLAPD